MFITIEDGIVETSEGDFIRQKDITKVKFEESGIDSREFVPYTLEKVETKVFYSLDTFAMVSYHGDKNDKDYYDLYPEISGLGITDDQRKEIIKCINDGKTSTMYTKSATYGLYNKDMILIGSHSYSKEYEDKLYLMAQWQISLNDMKDLCKTLLNQAKEKAIVK